MFVGVCIRICMCVVVCLHVFFPFVCVYVKKKICDMDSVAKQLSILAAQSRKQRTSEVLLECRDDILDVLDILSSRFAPICSTLYYVVRCFE